MDFSEAERLGFIAAFVDFWHHHPDDKRSTDDLCEAAQNMLRGCVRSISGLV